MQSRANLPIINCRCRLDDLDCLTQKGLHHRSFCWRSAARSPIPPVERRVWRGWAGCSGEGGTRAQTSEQKRSEAKMLQRKERTKKDERKAETEAVECKSTPWRRGQQTQSAEPHSRQQSRNNTTNDRSERKKQQPRRKPSAHVKRENTAQPHHQRRRETFEIERVAIASAVAMRSIFDITHAAPFVVVFVNVFDFLFGLPFNRRGPSD